jgi:VanZ family protein
VDPSHTPLRTPASERLSLWGPVVLYCALIFGLSSVSSVPALPGGMTDKMAHTILYSGLGLLVARAMAGGLGRPVPLRVVVAVLAFAALYGLSDEFHQLFVPHREFDLKDMAADAAGGGIGAALLWLWGILRRSRHAR